MMLTRTALGFLILVLGGCESIQSILDPRGLSASRIAQLSWVLFALGAFVLVIVVLTSGLAIRGAPAVRAQLATRAAVIGGGIVFPSITLTLLLIYGVWLTQISVAATDTDQPALRIEITGEQWWWRVAYPHADGRLIASANEVRLPAGRPVLLVLKSADVIHSFWVPNLAGKVDMIPGRTTHLRLVAEQPGIFRAQCAEYCGGPHALMALKVIALSDTDFATWMARQSAPASVPVSADAGRGAALFNASGCGGCHTVRGTGARGIIGPDLTHIGSRASVGIDTSPLNMANLAHFIADSQKIKPGNRMPPFRIFSHDELGALTSYLAGLQ